MNKYHKCFLPIFVCKKSKKIHSFFNGYIVSDLNGKTEFNTDLYELFSDRINYGFIYHYETRNEEEKKLSPYPNLYEHNHSFNDVVKALYDAPEHFYIPKEYQSEYSNQELTYLKMLQKYLLFMNVKNINCSNLNKREAKKEKYKRCNNEKILKYKDYNFLQISNKKKLNMMLEGKINKRVFKYNKTYKFNYIGKKYFLLDKDYNYIASIKIVNQKIIKLDNLKEENMYYKDRFKTFQEYKDNIKKTFSYANEVIDKVYLVTYEIEEIF